MIDTSRSFTCIFDDAEPPASLCMYLTLSKSNLGKILAILHPVGCPDVTVTDSNSKCNDFSFDGKIIPYSDGPIDIFSLTDDDTGCFVVVDDDRIEADVGDMIPLPAIILSLFCLPTLLFFFSGGEYDKDVALSIRYAVDNGAKIINFSFGKKYSSHPNWVNDAMKYASEKDVLIVSSAGNDSNNIDLNENHTFQSPPSFRPSSCNDEGTIFQKQ